MSEGEEKKEAFNPTKIATEELTHALYQCGVERSALERNWVLLDCHRQIVLNEMAKAQTGMGVSAALVEARISPQYREHVKKLGDAKGHLIIGRTKYDAIMFEIKQRQAKQFADSQEYKAGSTNT